MWKEIVERGAKHGVSETEILVLSSVRSQIPLKNRELVEWIIWYSQTGDHKYDDDEIEAAIWRCIERGWLQVLSKYRKREPSPSYSAWDEYWGMEGLLDFTRTGSDLVAAIFPPIDRKPYLIDESDGDSPT